MSKVYKTMAIQKAPAYIIANSLEEAESIAKRGWGAFYVDTNYK